MIIYKEPAIYFTPAIPSEIINPITYKVKNIIFFPAFIKRNVQVN